MELQNKSGDFFSHFSRYITRYVSLHPEDNCSSKQTLWDNLAHAMGANKKGPSADQLLRECRRLEEYDLQSYAVSQAAKKTFKLSKSNTLINPPKSHKEVKKLNDEKLRSSSSDSNDGNHEKTVKPRHEDVTICVLDDARKMQETFVCPRTLLLREMPYFEKFLESEGEDVEVQFSVHCDIQVFKRLLLYASKEQDEKHTYKIEPKYAIHMLVSAEFLEMEPLVEECLKYCYENIELLLSMSGIIGLLSENLLERLANFFNHQEVSSLVDPGDKIKSKIFRKKAEKLLNSKSPRLIKCSSCQKVFSEEIEEFETCLSHRSTIGPYGDLKHEHKIDLTWDRSSYLQDQHEQLTSWASVYWRLWGTLHWLPCSLCGQCFPVTHLYRCRHHPEQPQFPESDGQAVNTHLPGKFPCCGQKTFRFNIMDPLHWTDGCSYRMHTLAGSAKQSEVYSILMTYKELICLPEDESPPSLPSQQVQFESLCAWAQDRISRPIHKSSTNGLRGAYGGQRQAQDENKDKGRLNPGKGDIATLVSQYDRLSLECPVWNPSSSVWHNQDAIREYDYRAMDAIIAQLKQL